MDSRHGEPFTDILRDLLGCGIFNFFIWRTQRKLASHEFSTMSLREFVGRTLEEVVTNRLTPVLASVMETSQVVDLQDLLRRFAFNMVCMVSLGIESILVAWILCFTYQFWSELST
uniref:Uncharacterized protein n=1 Tax=Nelumbo nucifera TaxID=4432 RepID=A0A822Z404_NELNU|nr:TPA_asm: hypothetical protein HUJ06_008810 [Nelumbo nucifera]